MNNWSRNKNELQTESSQELFSCLWCDADSSVCESISCFSGFLRCSFWYFQLSQDFSPLVTCFCTTSVSKPEIWSSRVASGREVTCRGKWAQNGGGALDGLHAVDRAGVQRTPRRALCEERGEVSLRFLSAVTSPAHLHTCSHSPSSSAVFAAHIAAAGPVLVILCQIVCCACYSSFSLHKAAHFWTSAPFSWRASTFSCFLFHN